MFAIVEIAGQQFKVAKDQKIFVHRLQDKEGSKVSFDKVLLLDDGKKITVGAPAISGAAVEANVLGHLKSDKVIIFKKKRRKGYRVKNGHRQALTEIKVEKILSSGAKSTVTKGKSKNIPPKQSPVISDDKPNPTVLAKVKKETVKQKKPGIDYSKMTLSELKKAAKDKGISGYTTLKKTELIAVLNQ